MNLRRLSTRVLLTCAVFATVQMAIYVTLVPVLGVLAALSPPAYAVVAGAFSIMLFVARLFTRLSGTATLTAVLTGLLVWAVSPIGFLTFIPLVASGVSIDLALFLGGRRGRTAGTYRSMLPAVLLSGLALFVVSLAVFSAEHLQPAFLVLTLIGRVAGQAAAAGLAVVVVRALHRAGVRTAVLPSREDPPESDRISNGA